MKEMKPKVLICVSEDFHNAVNLGYYDDEYNSQIKSGKIGFITTEEAQEMDLPCLPEEKDIFSLNPFNQQYILIGKDKSEVERFNIEAKAFAIKGFLELLGAHCVMLLDNIQDIEKRSISAQAGGTYGTKSGNLNGIFSKEESINWSSIMESFDPNNTPANKEVVHQYMKSHGLMNEVMCQHFFEKFCSGRLTSSENIKIDFLSELKSTLDILATINFGPIDGSIKFGYISSHIHEVTKDIRVFFRDVPESIQNHFS